VDGGCGAPKRFHLLGHLFEFFQIPVVQDVRKRRRFLFLSEPVDSFIGDRWTSMVCQDKLGTNLVQTRMLRSSQDDYYVFTLKTDAELPDGVSRADFLGGGGGVAPAPSLHQQQQQQLQQQQYQEQRQRQQVDFMGAVTAAAGAYAVPVSEEDARAAKRPKGSF
jgi:hypothetical protein